MNVEQFQNPDQQYRNAPFWSWNDKLNEHELIRQYDEMLAKGWGNFFLHPRVGLITGYLSEEWMKMIDACLQHAKQTGTYIWLYDEDKWPSGFAGGIVPEQDVSYRNKNLILLLKDQVTEIDEPLMEINENNEIYVICKRTAPLGHLWFNGASYVDLMNPEMVQAFLESTHEKYKELFGESFGNEIPGIFTDEPCYNMNFDQSIPILPWSDHLPEYFLRMKKYDIRNHLDQLFFDKGDYYSYRYDFFDVATHLFMESFIKQYHQWCQQNHLKLTGHFMAEDNLISQTKWIGAAMPHYQHMDWPGIDKLRRDLTQLVTIKQLTSVADQLGKERALSEVFGCMGQQANFFHRKWITDWQAVLGISFVNLHLALYSMRGERKRDFPPNLFYQQPWWEDEKPFADYTARLSYALTQGQRQTDILVLHPIASVWSEYSPMHGGYDGGYDATNFDYALEKAKYNEPFRELSYKLMEEKLDFHFGDEIIMEQHAKVADGKLWVGQFAYTTLVLPPMLTLRANTLRLIHEFSESAGWDRVLFLKQIPERVDGRIVPSIWPVPIKLLKTMSELINVLNIIYPDRIQITDVLTGRNATHVIMQHRMTDHGDVLFLANTDEYRETTVQLRFHTTRTPIIMDLATGQRYSVDVEVEGHSKMIEVKLYPAGSLLLHWVDRLDTTLSASPKYLQTGAEFHSPQRVINLLPSWNPKILEHNVLPLDHATFYIGDEPKTDHSHLSFIWHDHYYPLPDETPFRMKYIFYVQSLPRDGLTAVIELAEHLDWITINGTRVHPTRQPGQGDPYDANYAWKDVHFTKIPLLNHVMVGENELIIQGRKRSNVTAPGLNRRLPQFQTYQSTEAEIAYIIGDFRLAGDSKQGFKIHGDQSSFCSDNIVEAGYPFYAGTIQYETEFVYEQQTQTTEEEVYLQLNQALVASVRLYVNGQYVHTSYAQPFMFQLTSYLQPGVNSIRLLAANTLFNLTGPQWIAKIQDERMIWPKNFIDKQRFTNDYQLMPFGIQSAQIVILKK